jgi:hypothetical protein
MFLGWGCGGPAADPPSARHKGGSGGATPLTEGGAPVNPASAGTDHRGGAASGGTTSTYVESTCPSAPLPTVEAECVVGDLSSCPAGEGCYPTITYPSAPCEPEIYRMLCLPAGSGRQWDSCYSLTDCASGYICVVGSIGTECQLACDTTDPKSCPSGLFCEAIDLQGIGTCY